MGVFDRIVKDVKARGDAIREGNKQTEGLGSELAEKSKMIRAAQGESDAAPAPKVDTPSSSPVDRVHVPHKKAPDLVKKITDSDPNAMKPLGSFKKGTTHVPQTGMYQLHEGEAVIPKEHNTMNAADAMAGITGKAKPAKKIKRITTHKTDDGKLIHTHEHHHPAHHKDETHVSNNMDEMNAHMAQNMPNVTPQAPEMPEVPAPGMASPGM